MTKKLVQSPLEVMRSLHKDFVESKERELSWHGIIEHLVLVGRYDGHLEMLRAFNNASPAILELVHSIDSMVTDPGGVYQMLLDCITGKKPETRHGNVFSEILNQSSTVSAFQLVAANLRKMRSVRRKDQAADTVAVTEPTEIP